MDTATGYLVVASGCTATESDLFADVTFQCLGQWAGPADQHYLALRNTRPGMNRFPPYRCAVSAVANDVPLAN
jgi:hypothetical protein